MIKYISDVYSSTGWEQWTKILLLFSHVLIYLKLRKVELGVKTWFGKGLISEKLDFLIVTVLFCFMSLFPPLLPSSSLNLPFWLLCFLRECQLEGILNNIFSCYYSEIMIQKTKLTCPHIDRVGNDWVYITRQNHFFTGV